MSERIDGLPPGVKVSSLTFTRNREEMRGEFVRGATVTLEPDNVYGVLDLASVPIPAGYERVGDKPEEWFRDPLPDEFTLCNLNGDGRCLYASAVHRLHESDATDDRRRIILRKVKPNTKRVLVIELPILEAPRAPGDIGASVPRALDLGTITCIGAATAEYLVKDWRYPEPRYRIEEREA
jgi:hypothetical protein